MKLVDKILKDINPDNLAWISRQMLDKGVVYTITTKNGFKYSITYGEFGNLFINGEMDLLSTEEKEKVFSALLVLDKAIIDSAALEKQNRRQRLIDAILEG